MRSLSPPSLPCKDPDPSGRQAALDNARTRYAYTHNEFGLVYPRQLPKEEQFDLAYLSQVVQFEASALANRTAARIQKRLLSGPAASLAVEDYDTLYAVWPRPEAARCFRHDWAFAWQRVAGVNPIWLRGIAAIPDHFPVRAEHYTRAMGGAAADSLEAALAQGRLYLCDYACLHGIALATHHGRKKHVGAPLALFAVPPGRAIGRMLVPIAIQETQTPGPDSPIYTPADGARWHIARLCVQAADATVLNTIVHSGFCHMLAQRLILAAHTSLSQRHPLLTLWRPHFRYTLAVNQASMQTVFGPGGKMDWLHAPTYEAQLRVHRSGLASIEWDDLHPEREFTRRGVGDPATLPVYPVRDDGLLAFRALHDFTSAYVRLYYKSPQEVAEDGELQALVHALGAPEGGKLPRLAAGIRLATPEDVADLAARVIYRVSSYHAPINHAGYDWLGYPPNMPAALFAPPPSQRADSGELCALLPPLEFARATAEQEYLLARMILRGHRLGEYAPASFADARTGPLVASFQAALAGIESQIIARNAARKIPYLWLLPSRTTASIVS